MTRHQIITTEGGEELVVLSRADYDALVAAAAEAEEDAADVAAYDEAIRALGEQPVLAPADSAAVLVRHGLLKAARKRLGMSQEALAASVGVTQAFISEVEAGRKRGADATMRALADALGLSHAQLGLD